MLTGKTSCVGFIVCAGENFQVKMVEVQLEICFLRRGNLYCVGFGEDTLEERHGLRQLLLC